MKPWKNTVNFKWFWNDENMSVEDKGKQAAIMLKPLLKYSFKNDSELEEIIEMFECVSGDGEPPGASKFTATEDFDARMYDLYNWADCNRVWIKTQF